MNWHLIESDQALLELLQSKASSDVVIVDTEFMRRNTFYPQVALLQLCFESGDDSEQTAWLIDPLCIEDTAPLVALLTNPSVVKVLHSASEDLEVFQRWLGVVPQPLFDTQRAAGLLNIGFGMGYRALVHDICDVDLPKGEQRSNWLQRPLTESQCEYAALDVTWLLGVWRELHTRCEQQDKLGWVLADGADAVSGQGNPINEFYKRIKGASKLNPRQLGALAAISRWRENTARLRDKPRSWIIDDKTCLQLAQQDPASMAEMTASVDLPPPVLRRHGEELLQLLAQQRGVGDDELPARLPGPLTAGQRDDLKALKTRARVIAQKLDCVPEVLLQSKDYELLLREAQGEVVSTPGHWQGWRRDLVVTPLRDSLIA